MKAVAYFAGDWSVGISSYSFEMELPDTEMDDKEYREETRQLIKQLYTDLDGEFIPQIIFSDETM